MTDLKLPLDLSSVRLSFMSTSREGKSSLSVVVPAGEGSADAKHKLFENGTPAQIALVHSLLARDGEPNAIRGTVALAVQNEVRADLQEQGVAYSPGCAFDKILCMPRIAYQRLQELANKHDPVLAVAMTQWTYEEDFSQ